MSTLLTLQVEGEFVFEKEELEKFQETSVIPQTVVDRGFTVNQSGNHLVPAHTFSNEEPVNFEFPDSVTFTTVISDDEPSDTEEEEEPAGDDE